MPTTGYLAGTDANDLELSFANETTWGTSPTWVNYQKFRVNSESFAEQKNRSAPPELRNEGQTADKSTQDVQARGGVQFGISYGHMDWRWEEHTSELQSLMRITHAFFCLKKTKK